MQARIVALTIAMLLALATAARADERPSGLPEADRSAIRTVIEGQLGAFRRDDEAAAFGYASPGIQRLFNDPATFMEMVRRGYRPVYRPRMVAFGALVELDGRTAQKLELVGPDGARELALYFMEREPDGTWRVDGCLLLPSEGLGA
jgi:hypothetical protein